MTEKFPSSSAPGWWANTAPAPVAQWKCVRAFVTCEECGRKHRVAVPKPAGTFHIVCHGCERSLVVVMP